MSIGLSGVEGVVSRLAVVTSAGAGGSEPAVSVPAASFPLAATWEAGVAGLRFGTGGRCSAAPGGGTKAIFCGGVAGVGWSAEVQPIRLPTSAATKRDDAAFHGLRTSRERKAGYRSRGDVACRPGAPPRLACGLANRRARYTRRIGPQASKSSGIYPTRCVAPGFAADFGRRSTFVWRLAASTRNGGRKPLRRAGFRRPAQRNDDVSETWLRGSDSNRRPIG